MDPSVCAAENCPAFHLHRYAPWSACQAIAKQPYSGNPPDAVLLAVQPLSSTPVVPKMPLHNYLVHLVLPKLMQSPRRANRVNNHHDTFTFR